MKGEALLLISKHSFLMNKVNRNKITDGVFYFKKMNISVTIK
ncbi:hypothetical protein D932_00563 [Enterococcus casseliflavus 14-MB-W-14]|nr:hypothetical protein D932_00563 [Enterococcus casseliflavus 14-MB-W-14]